MDRRQFLQAVTAAGAFGAIGTAPASGAAPGAASDATPNAAPNAALNAIPNAAGSVNYRNLLVLIELKGGNDGLNTVVPYASDAYYRLRPRIGIPRDKVLQIDPRVGLHPALEPLLPLWRDGQLAVVQGVGYANPNLSHFRSIEIWDTASQPDQYLNQGWLTRTFARWPVPAGFGADGVVVGGADLGPLDGGARVVALTNPAAFLRQARFATPAVAPGNPALAHILKVEADIVHAADALRPRGGDFPFQTAFPAGAFGSSVRAAMQVVAASGRGGAEVAVVHLSLGSFDTHTNQLVTQAALLRQLAHGMVALRGALTELDRWNGALVMTYSEFGRRPRENQNNGTDHGTAAPHFVAGGRVRGGLLGPAPALDRLEGGNLVAAIDFRQVYATVLERWWGVPAAGILGAGQGNAFVPLDLLRA